MKVAIVHDWLYGGGAEKVVEELHKIYPDAPIYASYCTEEWRAKLDGMVVTGYLNRWPFTALRKFLPLLRQKWFSGLDLSEYDVVISSSGNGEARFACSKQKVTESQRLENKKWKIEDGTIAGAPIHISYTHTPTHFYYRKYDEYLKNPGFRPAWLVRFGLKALVGHLRKKDYAAAQKIDYLIANSSHIQADINQYYGRDSEVIHPPVNTERFQGNLSKNKIEKIENKTVTESQKLENKKWKIEDGALHLKFIAWGRLVPYKRFDLAVEACNRLGVELTIIGDGPEFGRLQKMAGPTVKLLGWVDQDVLQKEASTADAFLFAGEEDFGIAPVEAMAAGLPVIAYKSGGALDYVVEGTTGLYFDEQTPESLVIAIQKFNPEKFEPSKITQHAVTHFDSEIFRHKIVEFVERVTKVED